MTRMRGLRLAITPYKLTASSDIEMNDPNEGIETIFNNSFNYYFFYRNE